MVLQFDESKHPRDNDGKFTDNQNLSGLAKEVSEYKETGLNTEVANYIGISKKKKSIRSLNKVIEKHRNKIKSPEVFYPNWDSNSEIEKERLISHWEKEIKGYEKEIEKIKNQIGE